jgi:hypothetical protein
MSNKPTLLALLGRQPPVELLLHPLTLAGLALMILNDGWLRGAHPGWLTGKLSDFAAVVAYPGLLAALWGLGAMAGDRLLSLGANRGLDYSLRPAVILGSCGLTGGILAGINLWPPFRDGYLAVLQQLDVFGWFGPFHYTMDPSDLLALLLLPAVWLVGRRILARVPAGRLRAAYRQGLIQARDFTEDVVRDVVDRHLVDVRRAHGAEVSVTLDAIRDLLVEAAMREASPRALGDAQRDRNVALAAAEHYHRLRQALETHRNRGTNP